MSEQVGGMWFRVKRFEGWDGNVDEHIRTAGSVDAGRGGGPFRVLMMEGEYVSYRSHHMGQGDRCGGMSQGREWLRQMRVTTVGRVTSVG